MFSLNSFWVYVTLSLNALQQLLQVWEKLHDTVDRKTNPLMSDNFLILNISSPKNKLMSQYKKNRHKVAERLKPLATFYIVRIRRN